MGVYMFIRLQEHFLWIKGVHSKNKSAIRASAQKCTRAVYSVIRKKAEIEIDNKVPTCNQNPICWNFVLF